VIRQALLDNYLKKDIENYGILKITRKGKEFLKNPTTFRVTKDDEDEDDINDIESGDSDALGAVAGSGGAADPVLFSMMKDLRKKLSKKLNVPPYVIFQPSSLEAMATSYPITLEELQNIPGVGSGKAKRYGKEFVDLIRKHVEENDITRPEDLRVKTVANKSKLKVSIVQAIDRKVALDDLAESKGIDFNEMLTEVEAIVYSGTKINIDYFLNEVMDQDLLQDIYGYFKEAETDNLDKAQVELPEYSDTEIRLVRIKFFSDMAN
jgi:ATP-dependent DNA helicase RecQ